MELDKYRALTDKSPIKTKPCTRPLPKAKEKYLEAEEKLFQELEEHSIGYERKFQFKSTKNWRFDFYIVKLGLLIEIAGSSWSVGRGGKKIANALCKYDLAMDKGYAFERLERLERLERDADGEIIYSDHTGLPKHYLAGHDVEVFFGETKRWGADESVKRLLEIAKNAPTKSYELPNYVAGQTYSLADQRISWLELEDSEGAKVPYDMYVVDYDYGKFTLNGDFALGALIAPLKAKYRYQDMGLIRDVQINGQITFTKPVTHNYSAEDSIVGSALVIGDMQARYTRKFVQPTWSNLWADEATGGAISANYNDSLYPIAVTNNGAIQERWALVFTSNTDFRIVGEYSGQIGLGSVGAECTPINPVTGAPYFTVKKEGWGAGWASGNVLRFNTIAATFPVWVIRTVKQSEPTVLSDQFQIMLRGDIDRVT